MSLLDFDIQDDISQNATGRCLLPSGVEHICAFQKLSTTHTAILIDSKSFSRDDIVICSFPTIGIVPGVIVSTCASGFVMKNVLSSDRILEFAEAVQKHDALVREAAERRSAPRIVPAKRNVRVWYCEKTSAQGVIENLSITGAAIAMNAREVPFQGSVVRIGARHSTVVRCAAQQMAVRFLTPIAPQQFNRDIVL